MAVVLSPSPLYKNWAMSSQVFFSRSFSIKNWIPWKYSEDTNSASDTRNIQKGGGGTGRMGVGALHTELVSNKYFLRVSVQ